MTIRQRLTDIELAIAGLSNALNSGGGGGTLPPAPAPRTDPYPVSNPCGCLQEVPAGLELSPCLPASGSGGLWIGNGFYRIEDGSSYGIEGFLRKGSYTLSVEFMSSGEDGFVQVVGSWLGGGFSDTWPYNFPIGEAKIYEFDTVAGGDISIQAVWDGSLSQFNYVKINLCRRGEIQGGRVELPLDVKPRPESTTGAIGGGVVYGLGSKYKVQLDLTNDWESITTWRVADNIYQADMVFYFELFPDLPEIIKTVVRGTIAAFLPSIGALMFAEDISVTVLGVPLIASDPVFEPENDGFKVTVSLGIPLGGILGIYLNPLAMLGMIDAEIDFIDVASDPTVVDFFQLTAQKLYMKWSKVILKTTE